MAGWKEILNKMHSGDCEEILSGFTSPSAMIRINAIAETYQHEIKNKLFIQRLKELTTDEIVICGYRVGDFAKAALHLLGVEPYTGDSSDVERLIEGNLDFYS